MAEPLRIEVVLQAIDRMTAPARAAMGVNQSLADSLSATRRRMVELDQAQRNFNSYTRIREQLGTLDTRLVAARERAAALAMQFNATATPSARLTQQFQRARDEVNRLDERHNQLNQRLQQTRQRITDAGIPMRSLVEAQRTLRTQTEQTTHTLEQQARSMGHLITQQQRLAEQHQRMAAARNTMQNTLQMQQDIAGVAAPTMAVGAGMLYSAAKPVMQAANLTDQVKDIAITGGMTNQEESKLREQLRAIAIATNQEQSELNKGVQILVANGMKGSEAANYAELLGDTATASRAAMDDISNVTFALQNNLKINGKAEMAEAMNNLVHAGKQGQFELKDMAKYFPSMAANMASMGATGQDAAKELAIAMQAARKTTGTAGQAAANMANWFSHMTANSTNEHFASVGIDLKSEMLKRMQNADPAKRMSAFTASIDVFDQYIDKITAGKTIDVKTKKGKVIQSMNFRDALENAKASGNEAEVSSIIERFGLSKVIQDMQTANFYLAMRQNKGFINKGMQSFNAPNVQQTIANDKAERMQSPIEQFKAARIAFDDTLVQAGDTILPIITPLVKQITDIAKATTSWAKENPALVSGLIKVAAVVGVAMVAFGGVTMFLLSIVGPMAMFRYAMTLAASHFSLLRIAAGGLGGVFGAIKAGVLLAGNAILWLGRALMMNPIGLAATAIAGAAYLIYNNWETIKPALSSFWDSIKQGWDTMYSYVSNFVKNVLGFFSDLPNALLGIGQNTITGLLNGLIGGASSVFEWITSFFGGIVTKAKELLGIQSPSTVFAEIGGFLVDGMLQGITNGWGKLTTYFDEAITSMKEKWQGVVEWFGNTKVGLALGDMKANMPSVGGLYQSISNGGKKAVEFAKSVLPDGDTWENVKKTSQNIWHGGIEKVSHGAAAIKGKVADNWNNAKLYLVEAAKKVGIDPGTMAKMVHLESRFNHKADAGKISSAHGYGQFLDATWVATVRKHGAKYGIDTSNPMAYRDDKKAQALMMAEFTNDNLKVARKYGGNEATNAYLMHNLGTGGGERFLKALTSNPNAPVSSALSAKEIRNNPSLYKGGGISLAQAYAGMGKTLDVAGNYANEARALAGMPVSKNTSDNIIRQDNVIKPTKSILSEKIMKHVNSASHKVSSHYNEAKSLLSSVNAGVHTAINSAIQHVTTKSEDHPTNTLNNANNSIVNRAKNLWHYAGSLVNKQNNATELASNTTSAKNIAVNSIPLLSAKNNISGNIIPLLSAKNTLGVNRVPSLSAKNNISGNVIPLLSAKNTLGINQIPSMSAQNALPTANILPENGILPWSGVSQSPTTPIVYNPEQNNAMPTSMGYLKEMSGGMLGGIANMAQTIASPFLGSKANASEIAPIVNLANASETPTSIGYLKEMSGGMLGGIANMAQTIASPFINNKQDALGINPIVKLASNNNVLPFSPAANPGSISSKINNLVGGNNLQSTAENYNQTNNVVPFAPKATAPSSNQMGAGGTVVNQTITITVNAEKGMDEKAIAHEVAKQLREHERKAEIKHRGRMYDG